jgi:hypothetical protein
MGSPEANSHGAGIRMEREFAWSGKSQLITMKWVGAGASYCSLLCDPALVADAPWAAHHRSFMK